MDCVTAISQWKACKMLVNSKLDCSTYRFPLFHTLQCLLFLWFMLFFPGLMELGMHTYIATLPIAAVIITSQV